MQDCSYSRTTFFVMEGFSSTKKTPVQKAASKSQKLKIVQADIALLSEELNSLQEKYNRQQVTFQQKEKFDLSREIENCFSAPNALPRNFPSLVSLAPLEKKYHAADKQNDSEAKNKLKDEILKEAAKTEVPGRFHLKKIFKYIGNALSNLGNRIYPSVAFNARKENVRVLFEEPLAKDEIRAGLRKEDDALINKGLSRNCFGHAVDDLRIKVATLLGSISGKKENEKIRQQELFSLQKMDTKIKQLKYRIDGLEIREKALIERLERLPVPRPVSTSPTLLKD